MHSTTPFAGGHARPGQTPIPTPVIRGVLVPQEQQLRPAKLLPLRHLAGVLVRPAAVAALLALGACSSTPDCPPAAAGNDRPAPVLFAVDSIADGRVWLEAMDSDSARVMDADSLSVSIRVGEIVKACNRPTSGGRVVTMCRDGAANAARRGQR